MTRVFSIEKKAFMSLAATAVCLFGLSVQSASADTIVEIAVNDPDNFSSLVEALTAQDLVDTLSGEGPFTVFAPMNEAFAALPSYVGDALATDGGLLTDILVHHVVAGEVTAAEVTELNSAETLSGGTVAISTNDGTVFIDQAEVIQADVMADNGVVHVIDAVLVPNSVYAAVLSDIQTRVAALLQSLQATHTAPTTPAYSGSWK